MKITKASRLLALSAVSMAVMLSPAVSAQESPSAEKEPIRYGSYISVAGSYVRPDKALDLDDGYGTNLMIGLRRGIYAMEVGGNYTEFSGTKNSGFSIAGLLFPFEDYGLFFLLGASANRIEHLPALETNLPSHVDSFSVATVEGGAGYLLPLNVGRYQFGVRLDARYRYGRREKELNERNEDLPLPRKLEDFVVNLGLQLPLSLKAPPPPPPEPVTVVAPVTNPDSDGDGVTDDKDQCPGTPPGTQVNDVGCPLPPPPPPCKAPAPGERISLAGCGTGDVIVLNGVNFEFNKSKLTVNAKTILDNVADELKAYSTLNVELAGHTDSKGTDSYNQQLSQARADSVRAYLVERGIAAERMTDVGYGETQPVADNDTEEGRELNRRVELKILNGEPSAAPTSAETAVPAEAAPIADAAPTVEPALSPDAMSSPQELGGEATSIESVQ